MGISLINVGLDRNNNIQCLEFGNILCSIQVVFWEECFQKPRAVESFESSESSQAGYRRQSVQKGSKLDYPPLASTESRTKNNRAPNVQSLRDTS